MTAKLYVRRGGGAAADTEYTQLNPSLRKGTPVFNRDEPLIELGMRFEEGEASQGSFQVMDPEAELPTATFRLPPHAVVTLTEDASGDELWLARGRIAPLENGRSGTYIPANAVEWDVTVNDANMDMRGLPFSEPWVRPAETDVQRLNALQLYILNGASSTSPNFRETTTITVGGGGVHLCPNSNTVTMPAKTYPPGTQPADVLADCRETAGKIGAVVIHHRLGASHLCLLYIKEDDHTTFATAVKISDQVADWDPTDATAPVFEPKWDMGKATAWDHDFVTTALVSIWGGTNDEPEAIYVERPSLISDYEYWGETYNDSESETEAQAELRANRELDYHHVAVATHRASILVSAAQTKLLCAGMSLQVKSAAIAGGPDLGTYVTRRIAELKWEPNPDGRWWAHMQLGRGLRLRPPRRGSVQPKATTPKPPSSGTGDPPGFGDSNVENGENANVLTVGLDVPVGTDQALVVFTIGQNTATGVIWDSDGSLSGVPTESFTKLDGWSDITSAGFTQRMSVWYLLNPTPRSDPSSFVRVTLNGSLANAFGVMRLTDVNQSDPFGNYVFNQNTGATASTSVEATANQTVVNFAGWMSINVTPAAMTADAGQTQAWSLTFNNSAGRGDIAHGGGYGDASPSWSIGSSKDWMIVALAVNGNGTVGDTTEPVGDPGSADPGTGGTYAPINHIHEHGFLSEDGEHQHDATDIQYDDTASGIDVDDVQEAIAALAAAAAAIDHGALTGLTDDDHTQYLLKTLGGKADINTVPASGSSLVLDLADGNCHVVTLTDDCAITFSGLTSGVECRWAVHIIGDGTSVPTFTGVEWPEDTAPTFDATAASHWVEFVSTDGGTTIYGDFGGGADAPAAALIVREVGGSDIDPASEVEFDADDFVVTDQTGGVARVALAPITNFPKNVTAFDGTDWSVLFDGDGNCLYA